MPKRIHWRHVAPLSLAVVPLALAVTAVPGYGGDFTADPVQDFDCDDVRDAVHSTYYETVNGHELAGSITVQYSTDDEIAVLTQDTPGIDGAPEYDDQFGKVYTAFDENGDGCDDLVVSAPWEGLTAENGDAAHGSGMVWIIPGSPEGLRPDRSRSLNLDTPGVPGAVDEYQHFGASLASGVTADGEPFLVIGTPGAKIGGSGGGAGAVYYLRGDEVIRITQDSPGVAGKAESNDYFGEYLSVTDRYVAVSASGEEINGAEDAGMVHVFNHIRTDGSLRSVDAFHQDTPGISGTAEEDDEFGERGLSVLNYRTAPDEPVSALVAVGSPTEDVGDTNYWQGMAHLIRTTGPTDREQLASVHQDTPGVEGEGEPADFFGGHIVLSTDAESGIGGPNDTHWAVSAEERGSPTVPGDDQEAPQVHVFDVSATPGDTDVLIEPDDFGVPLSREQDLRSLSASGDHLYLETPGDKPGSDETPYPDTVYGVPWPNILDGQDLPVLEYRVTPWP